RPALRQGCDAVDHARPVGLRMQFGLHQVSDLRDRDAALGLEKLGLRHSALREPLRPAVRLSRPAGTKPKTACKPLPRSDPLALIAPVRRRPTPAAAKCLASCYPNRRRIANKITREKRCELFPAGKAKGRPVAGPALGILPFRDQNRPEIPKLNSCTLSVSR